MQARGIVPLHAEKVSAGGRWMLLRFWFRRLVERALAGVFLQRHGGLRIHFTCQPIAIGFVQGSGLGRIDLGMRE
jgi:uncharacterized membrane protein YhfC